VEYFGRVAVTYGTASWPHEQDICPDTLYEEAVLEQRITQQDMAGQPA